MRGNKKVVKKKIIKAPFRPAIFHKSTTIAEGILEGVLQQVDQGIHRIQRQKYLRRNLPKFAYIHHLLNFQNFFHKVLFSDEDKPKFVEDRQPKSIPLDSLSPVHLQKQEARTVVSVKESKLSVKQSRVSTISRTESKSISTKKFKKEKAVQLKLEPIQQSKFVGQLRQKKLDSEMEAKLKDSKQLEQKKAFQRRQAYQSLNISYDYNGQILHRYDKEQNNLVKKLLELKLKNQRISKKGQKQPEEEPITSFKKKGYQKRERQQKKKESQFNEFLDSQSLADSIQITRGIKYSHNSLVFQEKKRTQSIPELKSSLGKRKMSKPQFSRIKEHNQNKRQSRLKKIKTEQFLQSRFGHKRAYSQANFDISRFRKRDAINVINPELKKSMLIRLQDYQNFLVIEKQFPIQYEDCLAPDKVQELSMGSFLKNDEEMSRVIEPERMTPKLPPISRRETPKELDRDSLVISKLNESLRNKIQI